MYSGAFRQISEEKAHSFLHWSALALVWPLLMSVMAYGLKWTVNDYVTKELGKLLMKKNKSAGTAFGNKPNVP
jgi:hypothetical protein